MTVLRVLATALLAATCAVVPASCGGSAGASLAARTAPAGSIPAADTASAAPLRDWPEFGLNPQRTDATEAASGITAANVAHLRHVSVPLPGTVDSSPIYLHGVLVAGAVRDAIVVTTTYGRTIAIDAAEGRVLWTFTPPGYGAWAGSSQITTATPIADPGGGFVYAASPDGLVHKLKLSDGSEASGWPVSVTRDATHEKLAAALNIDGRDVLVATGGYYGDAPPYQGHVVAIDRSSGRVAAVFNTLCAGRRALIVPSSCASSDSAILSRGGVVVEPGGRRVLLSTGNGPWNGTTDFGDSVLELSFPSLALRQSFTPPNQQQLDSTDTDLGASAPALLGQGRVALAGKDGVMRVLTLARLDGHVPGGAPAGGHPLGGEVQRLPVPGGAELFTAPAVWHHRGRTAVFVADGSGTAAYVLRRGVLLRAWENGTPGTSPVFVGGLLYVYDPDGGGIRVYRPGSPRPIATLPGESGHWNSPIVVDGHVIEPEGNGNDHQRSGRLEIFSAG
jgi:hypothetical protein